MKKIVFKFPMFGCFGEHFLSENNSLKMRKMTSQIEIGQTRFISDISYLSSPLNHPTPHSFAIPDPTTPEPYSPPHSTLLVFCWITVNVYLLNNKKYGRNLLVFQENIFLHIKHTPRKKWKC